MTIRKMIYLYKKHQNDNKMHRNASFKFETVYYMYLCNYIICNICILAIRVGLV